MRFLISVFSFGLFFCLGTNAQTLIDKGYVIDNFSSKKNLLTYYTYNPTEVNTNLSSGIHSVDSLPLNHIRRFVYDNFYFKIRFDGTIGGYKIVSDKAKYHIKGEYNRSFIHLNKDDLPDQISVDTNSKKLIVRIYSSDSLMYLYDFPIRKKDSYALIETSNYVLIHIYNKGKTYLFDRRDCSKFMKLKSGRYFNAFETELGLFCHSYNTKRTKIKNELKFVWNSELKERIKVKSVEYMDEKIDEIETIESLYEVYYKNLMFDFDKNGVKDMFTYGENAAVFYDFPEKSIADSQQVKVAALDLNSVLYIDYDKDGDMDVVFDSYDGVHIVGYQDKQFSTVANLARGYVSSFFFMDINEDGRLDLIIEEWRRKEDKPLRVSFQKKDGGFEELQLISKEMFNKKWKK